MAGATRNPKTIVCRFRERVPADARRLVGRPPIVKVTLGTDDSAKAAEEFLRRHAEVEAPWVEIRKRLQDLDDEQSAKALIGSGVMSPREPIRATRKRPGAF